MRKIILIFIALMSVLFAFTSCSDGNDIINTEKDENITVYKSISATEAKEIMDEEKDYLILDVRTEAEFAEGHIEGSVLIPDYEIVSKAESVLTDKNQLILVYCRSGRRSANAAKALIEMGYTNVLDFGGIIGWTYETVK